MAAALPVIGTVMAVVGALKAGQNAKAIAHHNAAAADRDAGVARQQAAADELTLRRNSARRLGSMRAAFGASGVEVDGSPMEVLESSAAEAEIDSLNVRYKGELRAMGLEETADLDRFRGTMAERQSYWNAGSELLVGGAKSSKLART